MVTSAAIVMVGVFSIFATLSSIDFKEMGVGLALAVLIDATIVRAVLLPATMRLLGDWNWYLPSWLGWLPHVALETPPAPVAGAPRPPPGARGLGDADGERGGDGERGRTVRVAFSGEVDLNSAPELHRRLREAEADAGTATLVVDLRDVTLLDSTGIGELVRAQQRARRAGRRLVVVRGRGTPIAQVLAATAMDRVLELADDPAAADEPATRA